MTCYFCSKRRFERARPHRRRVGDLQILTLFTAFFGILILNGCSAFEIGTTTTALSESGFVARIAETSKQQEAYAALPPNKLLRGVVGGNTLYFYKDEARRVVYVGGEPEYGRYMAKVGILVAAYETTEAKMAAQNMSGDLQAQLSGAWDYVSRSEFSKAATSPPSE